MKNKGMIQKVRRMAAGLLAGVMMVSALPALSVHAEETVERYPYTFFAGSEEEGAITIHAGNFCVNGNVATNGTILADGNMNINGTKTENSQEEMIYILQKLEDLYFTGEDVEVYPQDYSQEETNININNPMDVQGELELIGNINLNTAVKALEDVNFNGEVKNTNDSVICSEAGNIIIDSTNVNLNGLVYAPNGEVHITAQNLNLNNVIIIADIITLDCPSVNANYSKNMAEIVGIVSENAEQNPENPNPENPNPEEPEPDIPEPEEPNPEEPEEIRIYAFGEYLTEEQAVEIRWYTNLTEAEYEILVSDDNVDYILGGEASKTTTYKYPVTEEFDKKYIKVSYTTDSGDVVETLPFVVERNDNNYVAMLLDSDNDGVADSQEMDYGTNIHKADTDDDGLTDYQEICITYTDPVKYDSVTEGISDAEADSDGDGLNNQEEIQFSTDPNTADTDKDDLTDYEEIQIYGTEPLNEDTDGDTLPDGEEKRIGLQPDNPETYGMPDAEYKTAQTIGADSNVWEEINTEDNPYEMSMDITASGCVEKNITIRNSSYLPVIQNEAILGAVPELKYTRDDSVEKVTLKFEIKQNYVDNASSNYPDEEELIGIKRFNIFQYVEEWNALLPVETKFDLEQNLVYAEVDELGSYCVMDMELWVAGFDVPEDVYQPVPALMSLDLEESAGAKMSSNAKVPVEAVFLLQTEGRLSPTFQAQKLTIVNDMERLIDTYGAEKVKFCLVTYNSTGAQILKNSEKSVWFTDSTELKNVLNNLSYKYSSGIIDREPAFKILNNQLKFQNNASKFIFELMNGNGRLGETFPAYMKTCVKEGINYSQIMPKGNHYELESDELVIAEMVAKTNGMNIFYSDNTEDQIFDHICKFAVQAPQQTQYKTVVPTGWKTLILDGPLSPDNGIDSDRDGLTDWEEANTDYISVAADGTVKLPTVQEMMNSSDEDYMVEAMERFKSEQWGSGMPSSVYQKHLYYVLNNTYVLIVHSDPTTEDSDGDGLPDGRNVKGTIAVDGEEQRVDVAPKDPEPLKENGPAGMWNAHIDQYQNGTVATDYMPLDLGLKAEFDQEWVDYTISVLLQYKETLNESEWIIRPILMGIKHKCENSALMGAYMLNFRYDNEYVAYHSQPDTWQREFGFNEMYDDAFRIGSQMNYGRADFRLGSTGEEYILWMWKGDYWNLQSGAEVGLYIYDETIEGTKHYDAVDFELPMTLSLYRYNSAEDIQNIFSWHPEESQWWVTGFNTSFRNADPEKMVVVGSIDFTGHEELGMTIEEIWDYYWENIKKNEHLIFDEDKNILWIMWDYGVISNE